jgi:zinc/manganese transport system substrate-binding protein
MLDHISRNDSHSRHDGGEPATMHRPTNNPTRLSWFATAAALVAGLLVASCGTSPDAPDAAGGQISVVATTSIWGDVVHAIVGTDADVESLIPVGADPHEYQPSSRDAAAIQTADLVVANGLGLEEGLHDVLEAAADEGADILEVAAMLDPLPFGNEAGASARGSADPHVWMDPLRVAAAADVIAASLTEIDPSVDWQARADAYRFELMGADGHIVDVLDAIPAGARFMVTNHDAFGYFADRYDFTILGVVIPGGSTLSDPSSSDLADLVDVMRATGTTVIFAETSVPTALADAVASEVGTSVMVVDLYSGSLGEAGSGAETLIDMLIANAETIAGVLAP